jgi:hypothetical protein
MVGWVKWFQILINDFFQMFYGWKFGYRAIVEKKNYKIIVKEILREISFILQMLEILYQDEYITINKNQVDCWSTNHFTRCKSLFYSRIEKSNRGQHVYPVHRLDRKHLVSCYLRWIKEVLKIMNDRLRHAKSKKILNNFTWLVTRRTNDWLRFNQWWHLYKQ